MDIGQGYLIAIKILVRGRGLYIQLVVSTLLLYYTIFVKHPQIVYLLILVGMLNVLTALLSDIGSHSALFYVLRICGAKPPTITTYVLTIAVLAALIGLVPVIALADFIKVVTALTINIIASTSLLYYVFLTVKKNLVLSIA